MSFATSASRFAARAARSRRSLSPATIQPYTGVAPGLPGGTADGCPLSVFLSAVRAERELADNAAGFILTHKAELRVLKISRWQPVPGSEFVNTATSERFRVNTASTSDFGAEVVCEVVRIDR